MQKPENPRNPTRPEFFGFSNFWPEKPEVLLRETRPDPDPNFRVRVFSRVFGYPMVDTLPTVREVWNSYREIFPCCWCCCWCYSALVKAYVSCCFCSYYYVVCSERRVLTVLSECACLPVAGTLSLRVHLNLHMSFAYRL